MVKIYKRRTLRGGHVVFSNSGAWFLSCACLQEGGGNASLVELIKWNDVTKREELKGHSRVPYSPYEGSTSEYGELRKRGIHSDIPRGVPESWRPAMEEQARVLKEEETHKRVPDGWRCDPDFLHNDGCDCACGVVDPDCGCAHADKCEEKGVQMSCCSNLHNSYQDSESEGKCL